MSKAMDEIDRLETELKDLRRSVAHSKCAVCGMVDFDVNLIDITDGLRSGAIKRGCKLDSVESRDLYDEKAVEDWKQRSSRFTHAFCRLHSSPNEYAHVKCLGVEKSDCGTGWVFASGAKKSSAKI